MHNVPLRPPPRPCCRSFRGWWRRWAPGCTAPRQVGPAGGHCLVRHDVRHTNCRPTDHWQQECPGQPLGHHPPSLPGPAGITEQLVDCSGGDEVNEETGFQRKAAALYAVLQEQRAPRSIVFCNKIETCETGGGCVGGAGGACRRGSCVELPST